MRNYEFKLTPAYCLYNGIAVKNQHGSKICFLSENPDNSELRQRVTKAFKNYIEYVNRQEDCPQIFKAKANVQFVKGNRLELRNQVSKLYSQDQTIPKEIAQSREEDEAAAVLLLESIMNSARKAGATDIHIEKNCIRFRIAGKLELYTKLSEEKCRELIQRIKFLAGMNVLEKRRSQDGHFVFGETEPIFARVSTVGVVGSTSSGLEESLVIRLLDTKKLPLSLENLGFNLAQLTKINEISQSPNGLIIICGPTGAGKSTTAAALLTQLKMKNNNTLKIVSLEDPPEYQLQGISQIQIDENTGNTFSQALSHVFRQDPDVLMIGEIRDEDSAAVAVRAALTGHLVIATLHTDSAAGSVLRLENLGIPINLIVSVLKGVIAQELNNFHESINLLADLAIPKKNLEAALNKNLSQEQLEELFEHTNNYMEVLNKNLKFLKEKHCLQLQASESEEQQSKGKSKLPLILPGNKMQKKEAAG